MSDRDRGLAWEARWARPTAIASFVAVALLVASFVILASLGGGGEAEGLREIHGHGGTLVLGTALQVFGFALLVVPLVYLFQAALRRSDRMRSQFRALIVVAPLALAIAPVLKGVAADEAASNFVAGKAHAGLSVKTATKECTSERRDDAAGFKEDFGGGRLAVGDCAAEKIEDDAASNAIEDASLFGPAQFLQLAGALGLAFAFVYCSLNALRAGLLSKFWGSLGIALGVALVIGLFQIALLWFLYLGLLVAGWVPGGRPPAWAAGEAIPWPSPGKKAAAELDNGRDGENGADDGDDRDS